MSDSKLLNSEFILPIKGAPVRLDLALLEFLNSKDLKISRTLLKEWIKSKKVFLDHRPVRAGDLLPPGNYPIQIRNALEPTATAQASKKGAFLPIVYEDKDLLVLNKTSGVPSAPLESDETETAVGAALAYCPALQSIGRGGLEPGLLHRLDTGTSGLLVFAKTQREYERLHTLWKKGQVKKHYRALVQLKNPLPKLPHLINAHLAHSSHNRKKMVVLDPESHKVYRGKPLRAVTRIITIHSQQSMQADLEIEIETGVMHQIRCHLSHFGWPILGDPIYGDQTALLPRLYLHAWHLKIELENGNVLSLESPLPEDWPSASG
jgi:23S rRNA pseudouridine1911/1915/1917 synthase